MNFKWLTKNGRVMNYQYGAAVAALVTSPYGNVQRAADKHPTECKPLLSFAQRRKLLAIGLTNGQRQRVLHIRSKYLLNHTRSTVLPQDNTAQ